MNFPDYYAVLGLPRFYPTQEEIRNAFLRKLVELNASGNVNPDARQTLDSAYLTLSDAKKKREYDEALDRYIQEQVRPDVVAVHYLQAEDDVEDTPAIALRYDWESPDRKSRCWSINPESDKAFDFLFAKAGELNQIIRQYPFLDIILDFNGVIESSMLFLYSAFFDVYAQNYAEDEIKTILENGLLLLTLYPPGEDSENPYCYPVSYSDSKKERIMSDFMALSDELFRAAQIAAFMRESFFDALAAIYIVHVFERDSILQKARSPDCAGTYQAMRHELCCFWERFYMKKEFVT